MKKHIAITGASSGIGAALALEFGRAGYRVSMIARRKDLLELVAKQIGSETFVAGHDLSDCERATEWIAAAEQALGPIDILVNNAGVQIIGEFSELAPETITRTLRVDLETPLRLTRAVLPGMIARGSGTIVDISSLAALAPTPFMSGYNAAKAGLAAASESLRGELLRTGVHVVTVYPGPVDTPMASAGYKAYGNSLAVTATPQGTPEVLAKRVRRAVERRRARVIYPKMYALARYFPNTTRFFLDHFTPKPRALPAGEPRTSG